MLAQSPFSAKGYVKELNSFFDINQDPYGPLGSLLPDQGWDFQIHNRVDVFYRPKGGFSASVGVRNRLFWGYQVEENPLFSGFIGQDPGWVDLSWVWLDNGTLLGHTILDRAWVEYRGKKWEARAGRQRINWGINLLWNPNDLFNQFNFFDFDYEERPGSDALLGKYFLSDAQSLQGALSVQNGGEDVVGALLYKFRWKTADVQALAGWYVNQPVTGAGWASNLGPLGWKMEFTGFWATDSAPGVFNIATGLDYLTPSGIFLQGYYLYNQLGATGASPLDFLLVGAANFSARNLYIYKHNLFLGAGTEITPLLRADLSTIVSNDLEGLALVPALGYSVLQDLEAYLLGQVFLGRVNEEFNYLNTNVYLRLRYSF